MRQCIRCHGPIHAEHVRLNRTPRGAVWRIRTYCAHCDILIHTRVTDGHSTGRLLEHTGDLFPRIITDRPMISRFLRSVPGRKRQAEGCRLKPVGTEETTSTQHLGASAP